MEVADTTVTVHRNAAVFVRAQRLLRRWQGATDHDPLLAYEDGREVSARALSAALKAATRELGIPLVAGEVAVSSLDGASWMQRHGISIQPIDPADTDPRRGGPRCC